MSTVPAPVPARRRQGARNQMEDIPRPPSARVRVRRLPERARYEPSVIGEILEEALICHVGFVVDGQPYVIPTIHARDGDRLYLHGSAASRMVRTLKGGIAVCVTASIVDGLVLARSAFHHSVNYRSVVVLGRAIQVEDDAQKVLALRAIVEHVAPGRWDEVRGPTPTELRQTTVLEVPLNEASAKVRSGPPKDDEADLALTIWAGELPLGLVAMEARDDPLLPPGVLRPGWLATYDRTARSGS
jgi:nitroimidazol reductase NimA-like FMN-containing flavoprotein (pyridoxamine 5'-phosphate oxidase superfamily)